MEADRVTQGGVLDAPLKSSTIERFPYKKASSPAQTRASSSDVETGNEPQEEEPLLERNPTKQKNSFKQFLDRFVPSNIGEVIFACVLWYTSGIGLTAINKEIFAVHHFNYPMSVTTLHFIFTCIGTYCGFALADKYNKKTGKDIPKMLKWPEVDWKKDWLSIVMIGSLTTVAIVFSNEAFAHVGISLMHVIKSFAPVSTYLVAAAFGLESLTWTLAGAVVAISASVLFAVQGLEGDMIGIVLVSLVVLMSAVRFVLIQYTGVRLSSLQQILVTQPVGLLLLLPFAVTMELPSLSHAVYGLYVSGNRDEIVSLSWLVAVSMFMALLVNFSNFYMVQVTSGLTLTVIGQVKLMCTVLMGELSFGETVPPGNWAALAICCTGLVIYSRVRADMKEAEKREKEKAALRENEGGRTNEEEGEGGPSRADSAEAETEAGGEGLDADKKR
uniref:Sugar phosphate transporter domain-containing protein n=1 Tax=Chromera velia CCMP2878 TaxID=1169474 RepID=A0A0G4HSS5_9ALVE|eukprot:Cvel_8320.t1-p1 / transcript=Cvel_8320.t1 / gene=Cvel_8320 / organism=Chromera_velia_CCMP2878 / gene_product=Probable sugar phosphate/phosphate translocator, putative / transcript_product=Probable sugar phosphate/phosphate translocator, putative / location=Cvel_scaffold457:36437-38416(-) / protein_length=443 / sequence_SO=supercontig / SO=protein_coding / is_pseudo=false